MVDGVGANHRLRKGDKGFSNLGWGQLHGSAHAPCQWHHHSELDTTLPHLLPTIICAGCGPEYAQCH
jgi:hypothetical protein